MRNETDIGGYFCGTPCMLYSYNGPSPGRSPRPLPRQGPPPGQESRRPDPPRRPPPARGAAAHPDSREGEGPSRGGALPARAARHWRLGGSQRTCRSGTRAPSVAQARELELESRSVKMVPPLSNPPFQFLGLNQTVYWPPGGCAGVEAPDHLLAPKSAHRWCAEHPSVHHEALLYETES